MHFHETTLAGAYLIESVRHCDQRGYFARTWCEREFADAGLDTRLAQASVSFNIKRGTWRGMHYQAAPYAEAKLVRCGRGSIWDVIVDLRPDSPTRGQHLGVELDARGGRMLYIPEGFAHGFITLQDETEVVYQMSQRHEPGSARGFRWNDPAFAIELPLAVEVIADRDRDYPDFGTPP